MSDPLAEASKPVNLKTPPGIEIMDSISEHPVSEAIEDSDRVPETQLHDQLWDAEAKSNAYSPTTQQALDGNIVGIHNNMHGQISTRGPTPRLELRPFSAGDDTAGFQFAKPHQKQEESQRAKSKSSTRSSGKSMTRRAQEMLDQNCFTMLIPTKSGDDQSAPSANQTWPVKNNTTGNDMFTYHGQPVSPQAFVEDANQRPLPGPQSVNPASPHEVPHAQCMQTPSTCSSNACQPPVRPHPGVRKKDSIKKKKKKPRAQSAMVVPNTLNVTTYAGSTESQPHAPHRPADRIHKGGMDDMADSQLGDIEDDVQLKIPFGKSVPETQAIPMTPVVQKRHEMSQNPPDPQMHNSNESEPSINTVNAGAIAQDGQSPSQHGDEVEPAGPVQPGASPIPAAHTDVEANPEPDDGTVNFHAVPAENSPHDRVQQNTSQQAPKKHRSNADRRSSGRSGHPSNRSNHTVCQPTEQLHQVSHAHRPAKVTKACSATQKVPTVEQAWNLFQWAQQLDQEKRALLDAELDNLRSAHSELQSEVEAKNQRSAELESKVHERESKITECREKFGKLKDFLTGLGHDLDKLREEAQAREREHRDTLEKFEEYAQERESVQFNLAFVGPHVRDAKRTKQDREAFERAVNDLETKQDELRKQINEKTLLLDKEKERSAGLENELGNRESAIRELRDQLENFRATHNEELANIKSTLTDRDQVNKESFQSLVELATQAQNRPIATSQDVEKLKTQLDDLKISLEKTISDLQAASRSESTALSDKTPSSDLETKLMGQLQALRVDLIELHILQSQLEEARVAKGVLEERCVTKDNEKQVLTERFDDCEKKRQDLEQKLAYASQQLANRGTPESDEIKTLRADCLEKHEKLKRLEEAHQSRETELENLKEALATEEAMVATVNAEKDAALRKAAQEFTEMRSRMTKDANKVREEQKADFENKLHQANLKRQEAEDALKKEKAKSSTAAQAADVDIQQKQQAVIESLRAEHQKAVNDLLQKYKAELQEGDKKHGEEIRQKVESIKKELQDKSSRAIDELHLQLAEAEAARDQALQKVQSTKRDAEEALKATVENSKIDLAEQHRRLLQDAEQERLQLQQSHRQELQEAEQRAATVEADLEAFRHNLKAQLDNPSVSTVDSQFRQVQHPSETLDRTPEHFKKPKRKVDRRTNTVVEMTRPTSQAVHGSGGSGKENVQPRVRTFSEINTMLSESRIGIFSDPRPSSALSDVQSMSTPDQRILRDLHVSNTPSQVRISDNSSSSWGQTQPLVDPFSQERPVSKPQTLPNSGSKRGSVSRNAAPNEGSSSVNTNALAESQTNYFGYQYQSFSQHSMIEDSQLMFHESTTQTAAEPIQNPKQINPTATADPDLQFLKSKRNLLAGDVSFPNYVTEIQKFSLQKPGADEAVNSNSSSTPDFVTESSGTQNITTYSRRHSRSQSIGPTKSNEVSKLRINRKRPLRAGETISQASKKSKVDHSSTFSTQVPETQYPSPRVPAFNGSHSRDQIYSTQPAGQIREQQTRPDMQSSAFKTSQSQQRSTSMLPPVMPTRGSSQLAKSQASQYQRFSDSSELSSVLSQISSVSSCARSSHANNATKNRRSTRAPPAGKNDRYAQRFNQELIRR